MRKLTSPEIDQSLRPQSPSVCSVLTNDTSSRLGSEGVEESDIVSAWLFQHVYSTEEVALPVSLFFDDYSCLFVRKEIDLRNWKLKNAVFQLLSKSCSKCLSLNFAGAADMTIDDFMLLRGRLRLVTTLSIKDTGIPVNERCAKIICSFASLTELDISFCSIDTKAFQLMAQSCKHLKILICQDSNGVDDYCLSQLTQCIQRFRKLQVIDIARTSCFTDTGLTSILTAGAKLITSLSISGCKKLSSFALVGLRYKMSVLEALNISHNSTFSQSVFEWIGEGCKALKSLNMCSSPALTDGALILIGTSCHELLRLNISNCPLISDLGIEGFMKGFKGKLQFLDISSNLECTGLTTEYLSTGASELIEARMNGVGNILNPGLKMFWAAARKLEVFEMGADLRAASNHRRSVLPHINDSILLECNYSCIVSMKISGAVHVTDSGACALIRKCKGLKVLNLSHCNKISNATMFALSTTSKELHTLNVSMCVLITCDGVRALCTGCPKLVELQLNGLQRLQDRALAAVPALRHLEVLSMRNCSYITDRIIIRIAKSCLNLRALDISGMDLLTSAVVEAISIYCPLITLLNCDACDIQAHVFAPIIHNNMPLITFEPGHCKGLKRPKPVIEYNKYVNSLKRKQKHCRVLSRFCKLVGRNCRKRDLIGDKNRAILTIIRVYSEHSRLQRMRAVTRTTIKRKRSAIKIERFFRNYWSKFNMARTAANFAREEKAYALLQRVYRGHKSRKKTVKRRVKRLFLCTKFRYFAWTLILLSNARKLKFNVIRIQSHMRRFVARLNYVCFLSSMCTLQYKLRLHMRGKERNRIEQLRLKNEYQRQNAAVYTIQKNYYNSQHNKMIISFVTFCGAYISADRLEFIWKAEMIQKLFRGYWVRKNLTLGKKFVNGQYRGNNDIMMRAQSLFRGYRVRNWSNAKIMKYRATNLRWKTMIVNRPKLILGVPAKIIQQKYRRVMHNRLYEYASTVIQRTFRGHKGRILMLLYRFEQKLGSANIIIRYYRAYVERLKLKNKNDREHMAAFKIQRAVKATIFDYLARQRMHIARAKEQAARAPTEKADKLQEKAKRILIKMKEEDDKLHDTARKIQKCYKSYAAAKRFRETAMANMKLLHDMKKKRRERKLLEDEKEGKKLKNRILNSVEEMKAPLKLAKKLIEDKVADILHPKEFITELERARIENALVKFQSGSILQQGIDDFHLTLGDTEASTFSKLQALQRSILRPYYTAIEKDMSGAYRFELILWIKRGSGTMCFTDITVQQRPDGISKKKLDDRLVDMRHKGISIACNAGVHIEILGHRTMTQGKGGFAINRIEIATNEKEVDKFESEGLSLAKDLSIFGYDTSLWIETHKPMADISLFNYARIMAHGWCDDRIIRVVEVFCLTEDDLLRFRAVYDKIERVKFPDVFIPPEYIAPTIGNLVQMVNDLKREQQSEEAEDHDGLQIYDEVSIKQVFKAMNLDGDSALNTFLSQSIRPIKKDGTSIIFSEYVNIVCFLGMLGEKDFPKFLFSCANTTGEFTLDREQFDILCTSCAAGSETNAAVWRMRFSKYMDIKSELMNPKQFQTFIEHHPYFLWSFQQIQQSFVRDNIGEEFWDKKRQQYHFVRGDMDVILRA